MFSECLIALITDDQGRRSSQRMRAFGLEATWLTAGTVVQCTLLTLTVQLYSREAEGGSAAHSREHYHMMATP